MAAAAPKPSAPKNSPFPDVDFEQFSNVDDVLKSFMDQDPQLKQHWEQLADSCSKAAQATTDEEFEASLGETLKNLTENAKSIAENSDISQDELAKIWSNLGINDPAAGGDPNGAGGGGLLPDIMPLVTNMMQNLLSKEVLYPALKDLTSKVSSKKAMRVIGLTSYFLCSIQSGWTRTRKRCRQTI